MDPCPSLFMQQTILTPVAKPFMPTHIYLILKQFSSHSLLFFPLFLRAPIGVGQGWSGGWAEGLLRWCIGGRIRLVQA